MISNITYENLYSNKGILQIHEDFLFYLRKKDKLSADKLNNAKNLSLEEQSKLIISIALILEEYIGQLFDIQEEIVSLRNKHNDASLIAEIKRNFIQKQVLRDYKNADNIPGNNLAIKIEKLINQKLNNNFDEQNYSQIGIGITELSFAKLVKHAIEINDEETIILAKEYAAFACHSTEGREKYKNGTLFNFPKKIDFHNLVNLHENHTYSARTDFNLTDEGGDLQYVIDQTNYCIKCHHQKKDSCSKGMIDKENQFKKNILDNELTGCPLEVKISEMNEIKQMGYSVAALAIICIDNPILPATGHRICNDCMKSCIYQKQEPVDIPQIETRILKDVLSLPFGFEIYSLLTRWNPLNFATPMPLEDSGYKILVVGMGPAGFTLSHYLLNQGHLVYGIDGLKIEPLADDKKLIKNIDSIFEELDNRKIYGFGGVTEYGITVRWNKNYLKLIRLILERRDNFALSSGVRFGSNITPSQAFNFGFDHIALCMGAGKPNLLNIENGMARGVRTASDFLMGLQLTGAFKFNSIANLQIRLPIIVVGGGLTSIDAATESLIYYAKLVEKFLCNIEKNQIDFTILSTEEKNIANEYIEHAKILRNEKISGGNIIAKLHQLGGVKIFYRKKLQDAPCYKSNHEELLKALEEGVLFIPNMTPSKIDIDEFCHVKSISFLDENNKELTFPARTIIVAAGTSPNNIVADEFPEIFQTNGKFLQSFNADCEEIEPKKSPKSLDMAIITHKTIDNKYITFFGDMHPSFAGNVVRAMASAKRSYGIITELLSKKKATYHNDFFKVVSNFFRAKIHAVNILSDKIVELVVESKSAAYNFKPGQFFRLQNYENSNIPELESMALTGAMIDIKHSLISLIILEMNGSTKFCRHLKLGQEVALMGPTGSATKIHNNKKILLLGGGLGNAVLFSIGQAFRACNSHVTYFAAYRSEKDIFKIDEIEKSADKIIWCCENSLIKNTRPQDTSFKGNILESLNSKITDNTIDLSLFDVIVIIGSDKMMKAVSSTLTIDYANHLKSDVEIIASINSPMQCMMKEICGQCIQKHVDENGKTSYIFSCVNQDQNVKSVDFDFLSERLKQNSLLEKTYNI